MGFRRPARSRAARLALAAVALAPCLGLGCQSILGIHDVARDDISAQGGGAGAGGRADGGGGAGGQSSAGFSVSLGAKIPRVVRGNSVDLQVTVARDATFGGAVAIALEGLPSGVTAGPATVAAGETAGVITVSAAPAATVGPAAVTLTASAAEQAARELPFTLLVAELPGTLDETLDNDGIATTGTTAVAKALAIQDDDKIVAAGVDNGSWMVVRYLPGGALDPDFGAGGVVTDLAGNVEGIAIQPDGKILVVGDDGDQVAVVRYNRNGTRDQAFGRNGAAVADGSIFSSSHGFSVGVQRTGQIIVVGTASQSNDGFVLRLSEQGAFDGSFPANGSRISTLSYRDVAIAPDDSIVIGGTVQSPAGGPTFGVSRRSRDGDPDPAFGVNGDAALGDTPYNGSALALQPDGKPVLSGLFLGGTNGYAFARFDADGSPDAAFGVNGLVSNEMDLIYARSRGVAVQTDGKIVGVMSGGTQASGLRAAILRRLADGSPDPDFGAAGLVLFDSGPLANVLQAVAVQRDGRIVAAGSRGSAGFLIVRVWD